MISNCHKVNKHKKHLVAQNLVKQKKIEQVFKTFISLELNSAWFNKLSAMLKSKACKISAETNCPNKKQNKLINIIIKLVL